MPLSQAVARFNRRVTNRAAGLVAAWLPPFVVVEHSGRRTGRTYRTPVWAFVDGHGLVIALTYGASADWVQNVLAAGGATITRRSRSRRYVDPTLLRGDEGLARMPRGVRRPLRLLHVDEFLIVHSSH